MTAMSKRPSIIDSLPIVTPAETAAVVDMGAVRRAKAATAVQHTSIYIPRDAYERLREIAFIERCKVHDLIMEGLDGVIARRGHPETATRRKA